MTIKKMSLAPLLLTLCVAGAIGQGVAIAAEQERGDQQANNSVAPASYDAPRGGSMFDPMYHSAPPLVITRSAAELSHWLATGSPVEGTRRIETGTAGTPGYGTRTMGTTNTSGYGTGMELRDGIDLYGVTGGRWGATGNEVTTYGVGTDERSTWIGLLGAIGLIGLAGFNKSKSHRSTR